jgi:hypothetical protein
MQCRHVDGGGRRCHTFLHALCAKLDSAPSGLEMTEWGDETQEASVICPAHAATCLAQDAQHSTFDTDAGAVAHLVAAPVSNSPKSESPLLLPVNCAGHPNHSLVTAVTADPPKLPLNCGVPDSQPLITSEYMIGELCNACRHEENTVRTSGFAAT